LLLLEVFSGIKKAKEMKKWKKPKQTEGKVGRIRFEEEKTK